MVSSKRLRSFFHTIGGSIGSGFAFALGALLALAACDKPADNEARTAAAAPPATTVPPAPAPVVAPEIIIDRSTVSVGNDHVPTGEPSLAQTIAALLTSKPGIEGRLVDLVAMRNAKPSLVAAVIGVLREAKASGAIVKTAARDDTTQKLAVSFPTSLADCAIVAWIAKDGVIHVWPAGGGAAKRVARGLAGPDMTLGTDAIRAQWAGCGAATVAIGAEDTMTWGLVFDLGTAALGAPSSRASTVTLLTAAVPGKKLVLP